MSKTFEDCKKLYRQQVQDIMMIKNAERNRLLDIVYEKINKSPDKPVKFVVIEFASLEAANSAKQILIDAKFTVVEAFNISVKQQRYDYGLQVSGWET